MKKKKYNYLYRCYVHNCPRHICTSISMSTTKIYSGITLTAYRRINSKNIVQFENDIHREFRAVYKEQTGQELGEDQMIIITGVLPLGREVQKVEDDPEDDEEMSEELGHA